jgi:hypothetical protein
MHFIQNGNKKLRLKRYRYLQEVKSDIYLYVKLFSQSETSVNSSWRRAPIFVKLQPDSIQ